MKGIKDLGERACLDNRLHRLALISREKRKYLKERLFSLFIQSAKKPNYFNSIKDNQKVIVLMLIKT